MSAPTDDSLPFTIAVLCDTQNYADHRNQREAGFPINAREMLWDMMHHISRNARQNGGDIAFVTGLGDSWQHPSSHEADETHAELGWVRNPLIESLVPPAPEKVREIEMPAVRDAYRIIADTVPFSLVPGNHDHDHFWTDPNSPPAEDARIEHGMPIGVGRLHVGSLKIWTSAFGDHTDFFHGKPWYVSSFRDGRNSAQTFFGGGYRFLHIGLEMCPDDEVLDWARAVLRDHPGCPTIISIHEYLNHAGERKSIDLLDLTLIDSHRNGPEMLWDKFVSEHDQILMTLNGHFHGVQQRIDRNRHGNNVYQFLVNYQSRKQSLEAAAPGTPVMDGIGDGWIRLLTFDLSGPSPRLRLRAYSAHFKAFATDLPDYARWYANEHPEMDAAAFLALDDTEIVLDDFHARFAPLSARADCAEQVQAAE